MLSALVLGAAAMVAPSTSAPIDFVHSFKRGDKFTYEMVYGFITGLQLPMTFALTMGATKDGKTDVSLRVTDKGAFEFSETDVVEFVIDANGMPIKNLVEENVMPFYMAMLFMYLPNKSLSVGDTFELTRKNERFETSGKGRFVGVEEVDGKKYAVLDWQVSLSFSAGNEEEITLQIKSYYDSENKRVERAEAEVSSPEGNMGVSLKWKK